MRDGIDTTFADVAKAVTAFDMPDRDIIVGPGLKTSQYRFALSLL